MIRYLVLAAALLVALAIGIAVGESLHDNAAPGGTQSIVRTLSPLPLAPAAESTVTVTVSSR